MAEGKALIREIPKEAIDTAFKNKLLTRQEYNDLLVLKAHETTFQLLEEKGIPFAVWETTIRNFQEGWEFYKEAALMQPKAVGAYGGPSADLTRQAVSLLAGQIQMLAAFATALGDVGGHKVEQLAMEAGASPGAARVLNIITDNVIQFIPKGIFIKKAAQALQMRAAQATGAVANTASTAKQTADQIAGEADAEVKQLQEVLKKGIEIDNPKILAHGPVTPTEASSVLRAEADAAQMVKQTQGFTLPKDLAGAKPRFNVGKDSYELTFDRDLDKAAYILAQINPSKRDADYLKLVMEHMGISEAGARAYGREVKERVYRNTIGKPAGVINIPTASITTRARPVVENPAQQSIEEGMKLVERRASPATVKTNLKDFQKRTGIDPEELALERNWTQAQLNAYVTTIQPHVDELAALAQKAVAGGQPELYEFAKKLTHMFTANPTNPAKPAITTEMRELLTHWDPGSMAKGDMAAAMRTAAEDIATLGAREASGEAGPTLGFGLTTFFMHMNTLYQRHGANAWPMVREAYANILLPLSWAPTFIGNTITSGVAIAERAIGAAFSTNAQGMVNKEAYYLSKGMMLATGDGLRMFGRAFSANPNIAHVAGGGRVGLDPAIPGTLGRIMRTPGNAVQGMDNLFSAQMYRGALYARYIREADQAGLRGQAAGRYVLQQFNGPPTAAAHAEAQAFSQTNTFQNQLGRVGSHIQAISQAPVVFFYFPFVKSGINIAKYTWNRTPGLQLVSTQLYRDIAAGGAAADAAVGRLILSNMLGAFMYDLAREGYITGGGPDDPALRKAWLTTHQPYSIKTPAGWMSMQGVDPARTPMGIVADFVDIAPYMDEASFQKMGQAIAFSVFKNIDDTTWFRQGASIADTVQGLARAEPLGMQAVRTIANPIITAGSGGPLVNRVRQAMDPVTRDVRSLYDEYRNKIPGWSRTVPPLRDPYGDVVTPPQPAISNWFGLLRPVVPAFKEFQTDPVKIEGDKIQARMPLFERTIGGNVENPDSIRQQFAENQKGIRLSEEDFQKRIDLYQGLVRGDMGIQSKIMDNPNYKERNGAPTPQPLKREMFSGHMQGLWNAAGGLLLKNDQKLRMELELSQKNAASYYTTPSGMPETGAELTTPQLGVTDQEMENLLKFGGDDN